MKRGTTLEFDSLELLLDTICNTFGGILFLAVLVIILVHRTGERIEANSRAAIDSQKTSALQNKVEQRKSTLQSLKRAYEEYRTTLAGFSPERGAQEAQRVLELRNEVTDLTMRRVQYVQSLVTLNEQAGTQAQEQQKSITSLALARKEVRSLTSELERERASQTRTMTLPMLRQTSKREFPVIVRFGRLYFPFTAENGLEKRKSNLDDFVILDDKGPVMRVCPKPYAGTAIADYDELLDSVRRRTASLDRDSVYFAIGVWEDSFNQFQQVKEIIVKLGFEYRLVPVAIGEFIQESPIKETLVQ